MRCVEIRMPPLERAARETVPQERTGLNDIRTVKASFHRTQRKVGKGGLCPHGRQGETIMEMMVLWRADGSKTGID